MAFSLVTGQHAYVSTGASSTTVAVLPNNPTAGNLVVIGALWYNGVLGSSAITSIQDGNGNTYTQATNSPESTNGAAVGATYLFYRLVAPANANKTITITWTTIAVATSAFIAEFTATNLPAIVDLSVKGNGTGTTINTPTVTRTGANELMVLYATVASTITSANSPWVATETLPTANGDCFAYILDRSADTAANLTNSSSSVWDAVGMSFLMTAAGNSPSASPSISPSASASPSSSVSPSVSPSSSSSRSVSPSASVSPSSSTSNSVSPSSSASPSAGTDQLTPLSLIITYSITRSNSH